MARVSPGQLRRTQLAVAAGLVAAIVGCGGDSNELSPPSPPQAPPQAAIGARGVPIEESRAARGLGAPYVHDPSFDHDPTDPFAPTPEPVAPPPLVEPVFPTPPTPAEPIGTPL